MGCLKQVDRICSILADRMTLSLASSSCIAGSYSQTWGPQTYLECASAARNRHADEMAAVPKAPVRRMDHYPPRKSCTMQRWHRTNQRNCRVIELRGHGRGDATGVCCTWELMLPYAAIFPRFVEGQLGVLAQGGTLDTFGSSAGRP